MTYRREQDLNNVTGPASDTHDNETNVKCDEEKRTGHVTRALRALPGVVNEEVVMADAYLELRRWDSTAMDVYAVSQDQKECDQHEETTSVGEMNNMGHY